MTKEEALKFYQTYRIYIFPSVVALSSIILIVFVIYPQLMNLLTNQEIEKDLSQKSLTLEAKAQALETYNPSDLTQKVDYALGAYPTNRDFVYALSLLQDLVSSSGFTSLSITLEGSSVSAQNARSQSYNIKMELLGDTALLPPLLTNIENSPRIIRVSSVETTSGRTPQESTIVIIVEILYSSSPNNLGSIDSPLPSLSQKEEEVVNQLMRSGLQITPQQSTSQPTNLGPRGKTNPFE